jgi:hypothetical protein
MKDPTRLLASTDSTDLEKELLSSWDERPSRDARAKTLAMLGVASAATIAGTATAGASIAPKAAAAGWLAMAKWTAVAVVAVGATAAGIGIATRHHDEAAPLVTPTTTVQAPAPIVTATATAEQPMQKTIELPNENAHRVPQTHVAQPAASTLAEQVAALDRARSALDAHDSAKARKLVDAYEAEYPGGAFTQEAEVVRIEALSRDGNRAEAERAGKRFLATYPKSPHAARVRTLLGYDP